jgi:hypothetical protein
VNDINGFIWDSIYKASIKAGATEQSSRMQAGAGTKKYKCGQFKTTSKLIKDCIKEACKQKKKTKAVFNKKLTLPPVISEMVKTPAQEQIERIKQQAKAPPVATQSTSGSSDGLWSTNVRGKR